MKMKQVFAAVVLTGASAFASAESPVNYPDNQADASSTVTTRTRAQVKAELDEARRLGLIAYGEVNDKIATPTEERRIAEAGQRAVRRDVAER